MSTQAGPSQPPKRKRVERGRSKNGCLTCLTKKVKCDETKPLCNRCVRLKLECRWASPMQPLAERRRGLGPIKQRERWTPQTIVPRTGDSGSESAQSVTPPALTPSEGLQLPEGIPADMPFNVLSPANEASASASPNTNFPDLPPEGIINPMTLPEFPQNNTIDTSSQLILYPTPSFDLLSLFPSFSFTNPTEPAPSIGSDDVQAMTFHSTILAPMKSTRKASLSAHSIFLNFAVQNPMALHFLLAFSHSELAIHHGFSHRPPLESYLHFQNGSQLLSQALVTLSPMNHVAMMLSYLYLYMFWMRRDPLQVERLRELSTSILAYVTTFSLDEVCANSTGTTGTSEPVTLSRILTYIYDRDVFCGFFGCGSAFANYVSQKHETRQRIWVLSRTPILPDQTEAWSGSESLPETSQRRTIDVYYSLITIQYEINQYSQRKEPAHLGRWLEIRRTLDKIREEHSFLFNLSRDCAQQHTRPPLMALVTVTVFHALEIYLHRSRDTFFGETPIPADIERALQELVSAAYHTIPVGPVQLLERFQWALLICGIETHDPVYRDWISGTFLIMEAKEMKEPTPSCEMDIAEPGTVDTLSVEEEKKLVRKIDMRLMPLLIISYGLQYLDKTSLAYSAILGLREDLKLVGQQFSWASSIFYIGYLVASYPISLGFVKFPLGKYLSVLMFIWGVVLTLHAIAHNYASLLALRFFLGVFESAISPGFSLITGMWYTPHEHVSRHSFWFAGNASASMVGAMIAYGILSYSGPIEQWKMLFLIFGLITIAWSVVTFFFLPDSPATARFLSTSEREFASLRPKKFQRTTQTKKWDRGQFIETMKDVKSWWFFFFSFVICVPNGGTTSFSTIVIKSFGYDEKQTILMGLPASAFQLTTVILVAIFTTYVRKSRHIALVLTYVMAIAGILMIKLLPTAEKLSRLAGFWLIMAVAPAFPLMLSLSASNIAGFTKKSTVMAMIFLGYCAGNLSGPQFFISTEAPGYHTAYTTILACFAITIALVVGMYFYLTWENRRRDNEQGVKRDPEESRQVDLTEDGTLLQVDETDIQNKNFRYIL
ncbi:hypothetical protein FBEOM_1499 [Fusarium beomiforme]|uniref:Major facilitator superfamily (MFS) profile domain-containing protein n=1 Tax=Fusarium beomiforme TaxID=44412 RepID=A0A9P5E105_9HYPO|nr:hypothetical protein FBEOM_1499 [Fusarium beomiforme]